MDFPIILEKDGHLMLVQLANSQLRDAPIIPSVQFFTGTDPIELIDSAQRAGEKIQQAPHCKVVSCCRGALEARHIRAVDALDLRQRCFAAERAHKDAVVLSSVPPKISIANF